MITTACARPCDNSRAGPKAAWTNYLIFWEVGFLSGHITLANRKVYLAGIGETDDFRLRALRCSRKEEKSDEFSGTRTEPTTLPPAWVPVLRTI